MTVGEIHQRFAAVQEAMLMITYEALEHKSQVALRGDKHLILFSTKINMFYKY